MSTVTDTILTILRGMGLDERIELFKCIDREFGADYANALADLHMGAPAAPHTGTATKSGKGWKKPPFWMRHITGALPDKRPMFGLVGGFVSQSKLAAVPEGAWILLGWTDFSTGNKQYALAKKAVGALVNLPIGGGISISGVEIIYTSSSAADIDAEARNALASTSLAAWTAAAC